jgi:C4-dicarboxylate-specific signal transduction histidine kinase
MTPTDSPVQVLAAPAGEAGAGGNVAVHQHVRRLLHAFARTASSAFNLPAGLAVLCHSTAEAFGASRVAAWLHDRRSRELVLAACSDRSGAAEGARIRVDSDLLPAIALRRDHALRLDAGPNQSPGVIALPLRGRRRALGVLVLEGLSLEAETSALTELDDLGRQLSAAIENLLLLEDVLRSRRELAQTFDSLEDLVAVCDGRLRVVHVNRTLSDRFAHPRDRLFDRPLTGLVGEEAGAWLASVWHGLAASPGPATYARELDDEVLGGRFTMTLTPVPGTDLGGQGAVFVARDITRQARLESERCALRDRLAQTEKLAALGQFVTGIARQVNEPLAAILQRARPLAGRKTVPASLRADFGVLVREAERASRSIDNLLVFAGGRRASRRALSVNSVVGRALAERSRERRAARVLVARHLAASLPAVSGHAPLLQQAVANVLLNAEQALAARGGGRIDLTTTRRPAGRVRIEIRDSGPGIPASVLPRIFEPFFTTRDAAEGAGLGLAIAYGVVRDHGGTLTARNHPSGGALFTIDLPSKKD